MVASDHPGCCGAAARPPKRPGKQKLTPPSSAAAIVGAPALTLNTIASANAAFAQRRRCRARKDRLRTVYAMLACDTFAPKSARQIILFWARGARDPICSQIAKLSPSVTQRSRVPRTSSDQTPKCTGPHFHVLSRPSAQNSSLTDVRCRRRRKYAQTEFFARTKANLLTALFS